MSVANEKEKEAIVRLLREGQLDSNQIAERVGVSPQVVWGIKSHWTLGKYSDAEDSEQVKTFGMDISEIVRIIRSLADGIDPFTGKVFPEDSPYQHPRIIRSLYASVEVLKQREEEQRREPQPKNAGQPWSEAEDQALIERFDAGASISTLSERHGRTEGAMRSRLEKLGKLRPGLLPADSSTSR